MSRKKKIKYLKLSKKNKKLVYINSLFKILKFIKKKIIN